jgi:glucosamine--fructose-6-phosphate aminotransferase (isomerizing)
MCGIVGYLGMNHEAIDAVLEGLTILQNRGYDSVGLSTIVDKKLQTNKHASSTTNNAIKLLQSTVKPTKSTIAIGHTRWATHGSKTDINAHPHHDSRNRIALVHNGIIENFQEIKGELVEAGYAFRSSTDTEVISILIGSLLDKGETILNAIKKSVDRLKGTWALVIIHKDYPHMLWAVRNGSPLLLGTNTQCIMVASETSAFHQYVGQYIVLKDHDVLQIELTGGQFTYNKSLSKYPKQTKSQEVVETNPGIWPHWMIKEIREQPDAVLRAINNGARISSATTVKLGGLDSCRELLVDCEHLIILGCGTSFHAGLWSLDLFKSLYVFDTVSLYDGADFSAKDVPLKGKTACVLLSQSGETKDLQRCIQIIQDKGLVSIGVVNVVDSFIARETNCGVYLNAGREVAVASTKSFTNQCVVLALLAIWFSQNRGTCEEKRRKIIADLHQLSIQIANTFTEINEQKIRFLANSIRSTKSMFLLGKGKEEAIAKEGALKLKEIARIHAEGYSTSALKHGPFGLLEPGMPVIVMDIGEKYREKTASSIQEIKARDAWIYLLRDNSEDSFFNFESNMTFGGVLANISLQWLSYEYAVLNGFSPDYPRNLAKVVTVE